MEEIKFVFYGIERLLEATIEEIKEEKWNILFLGGKSHKKCN